MQPAPWHNLKDIFLAAVDMEGAEREQFLERICAGDGALREKVGRLLLQHEQTLTADLLRVPRQELPQTLADGEVLCNRFRILEFVGRGGMGEVYRAADLELGGEVALKTLQPQLVRDPQFLGRFRREVQLARQVTHPSVCRIFDVGRHQTDESDVTFLTMEFLPGETLSRRLRRDGRMSAEAALPLVRQIAAGLSALHDRSIIHRDLKPGNIMIVPAAGSVPARAVITDFGLARATDPATMEDGMSLSRSSQLLGTPEYMAPEQLLGKQATTAADIFAFGLVLYELVTAEQPFPSGRSVESAIQRISHTPASPREYAPDLSPDWETVILRCLAKDPAERPVNPEAIIKGLMGGLPPSPATVARTRKQRSRTAATALLALVLLAGFLAIYRLELWRRWTGFGAPRQHVAVLSFNVPGGDPALRMFADGLVENITSRLSQYEGANSRLMVVPASEVRQQAAKTPTDARNKFGADDVVEGSLQPRGDRVRLVMTLVDATRVTQTGTVVLEDRLSNAFELQDAAVEKLAGILKLQMRTEGEVQTAAVSPPAPGAYEYYLQARGYLQRNDQMQSLESAATLLSRATTMDPKFALAHSGLAQTYFYKFQLTRDPKDLDKAHTAGNHALELGPSLPESNIAMGRIYYGTGRHEEARRLFEKAIALDTRNPEAYQGLAAAWLGLKEYAKAEATYRKAISLHPSDWTGYKALGLFYYEREDYDKAAEQFQRVVDLTPDNSQGFINLGAAHHGREDWKAAEKAWLRALELDPKSASTYSNLGKIYLDRGQTSRAIDMYRRSLALNSRGYRAWGQLGRAYLRNGQTDEANNALRKAVDAIDAELLINPKQFTLYSSLAFYRALLGRSDYPGPLQMALDLAPGNGDVLERAAETYAIAGDRERARQMMQKALARGTSMKTLERSEYLKDLSLRN